MKKKGFTLIELLAVIVILAIIAVIATPIILGIVENTRKEAFQRSVELVVKATDLNVNNKTYETNYTYTLTDGVISDDVAVTNTEGMNGTINYDKDGNVTYAIYNDKWCVVKGIETTIKNYEEGSCNLPGTIFRITYVDGGTLGDNVIEEFTTETETFNLPNPTTVGKTFKGWYVSSNFEGEAVTKIEKGTEGNKTFYAKWEANEYTLTINADGGLFSNNESSITEEVRFGSTYTLEIPTNENYIFTKWIVQGEGSSVNNNVLTMGSADTTLTAVWGYKNGSIIYFDVDNGIGCDMEDYILSYDSSVDDFRNSFAGYNGLNGTDGQNSCLLFYAFNDDGGDSINLILDHNTTDTTYWRTSSMEWATNANGPIDARDDLKSDTSQWNGTIIPDDYKLTVESAQIDYTIWYNRDSYKARLITAQDIAKITGADVKEDLLFKENEPNSGFYLDSLTNTPKDTCTEGNITECSYGWLYDRTSTNCETYGCYNNANTESTGLGYWTGTASSTGGLSARNIDEKGMLNGNYVFYGGKGVRPVIEVLKEKVSLGQPPISPATE